MGLGEVGGSALFLYQDTRKEMTNPKKTTKRRLLTDTRVAVDYFALVIFYVSA